MKFTLETFRQLGICNHYNKLLAVGISVPDAIYKTSVFARVSKKQTQKILTGQTANSKKFGGAPGTDLINKWLR